MSNRLTIKGQVTIPKNVRDFLGLTAGSSAIDFFIDDSGDVRIRKAVSVKPRGAVRSGLQNRTRTFDCNGCDRVLALLSGSFA